MMKAIWLLIILLSILIFKYSREILLYIYQTPYTIAFLVISAGIIIRTYYLLCEIRKRRTNTKKFLDLKTIKTMIVLGSGGHTAEMFRILENLPFDKYRPRIYVHAETDKLSVKKLWKFEEKFHDQRSLITIISLPRSRDVHQSIYTAIFPTLKAMLKSFIILLNERPNLLLSNGPGTCVPLCLILFVFKIFCISNAKIIYVESFCRVKTLSLSGKILYHFVDNFIVQWPLLEKSYQETILIIMLSYAKVTTESIDWETLTEDTIENTPMEIKLHLLYLIKSLRLNENKHDQLDWINNQLLRIQACLDRTWETLNSGYWKNVPINYRYSYTLCSILKGVLLEIQGNVSSDKLIVLKNWEDIINQIDKGILLGAPLPRNSSILTRTASRVNEELIKLKPQNEYISSELPNTEDNCNTTIFPGFDKVVDYSEPSMETFYTEIFVPKIPAILKGCMKHWQALTLWRNSDYLKKIIGNRTVPIEIGARYTEESWTQNLVTFSEFLRNYINNKNDKVGYLAQHQLFEQVPELKKDFAIPEYCYFSDNEEDEDNIPDINAWFGPNGTVSPLHYDPKNNFLCQVFGCKRIILYSPDESSNLYPYEDRMLNNTAQVDPYRPDDETFPNFRKAKGYMCYLKPGEMLFIPPKWWHHVVSLSQSFSISFWWN